MARRHKRAKADPPAPGVRTSKPWNARAVGWALAVAALAGLAVFASRPSRPRRVNLVIVTIDTLRADHVGAYGYAQAETPALDGLGRRGARFTNALTAVPLTGPAHATIFTGQYPPVHGVRDNVAFPLRADHPTLATLLKSRGYRTAAFVAAYPVAAGFGFGQGFDHFNEEFHASPASSESAERPGNEVADRAIEWLAEAGSGPFFLWVHFYDPHAPYTPPPPYDARFASRPYDGEVAFADAQLGRVLDALRTAGRDEDTVVAVLADHGESLGERGEATHGILIYQPTLHVPFFLMGPGVPAGTVVTARVGLVDVLPTLLGLLGVEPPPALAGRDLRPALAGRRLAAQPLYAESLFGRLNCRWSSLRGWVNEDWKLVDGVEPELFDLAADPGERDNRAAREPQRLESLRSALRTAVQKMAPGGDTARAVALSPDQEERLRALGYVGGGAGARSLDEPGLPDPRKVVASYEEIRRTMHARGSAVAPALARMDAIVAADPGNPFANFVLGELAYRDGRLRTAARAFDRAVALDPDRPTMRVTYGRALRDLERLEDSERQLRTALEQTTPDDVGTRIALAETLVARGRTAEAGPLIEAVLSRNPQDAEAAAAKGRLLVADGRAAEAVSYLERAANGPDVDPALDLGELYLRLGQPIRAREVAERVLARTPAHPWAMALAGHALILEGRPDDGVAALHKAVDLHPLRPAAWLSLARAFDAAREPRNADLCRRKAEETRRK
ncbi:MAG TPA: sulfatase-like hydrolase/transferase [Vicinamibacteria bacterium]|jgi:arylsulfatase A-like enzyme/Flp pilus assembly protein TadD